MAAAAAKLFISYAREDRARVAPLAAALTAAGHEVWWDALIDGGTAFSAAIEQALERADAVIVAWSQASVRSDWVRDEAASGRDRHRLVPVSLDGAHPPLGFRQYHVIDLSRWNGRADAEAFAAVERAIAAARGAPAPAPRASARPARPSRRTLLIAGGAAAVVAGAGGLAVWQPWAGGADAAGIAVLPFKNMSGDPAQAYFSDGLAEEIRAALARNSALKVAAPTSANEFRDRGEDVRAIARSLGVAHVLEGSVRKAGDTVRVVATLIEAANGFASWTETFDRSLADIFAVQSEIAATVERALAARVAPAPVRAAGGTENVAAYEAYLQGRALFNADSGEESDRAGLAKFDAAIAADPGYAAAHAARSRALAAITSQYGKGNGLRAEYDRAADAARRAVALAPEMAQAQVALGFTTFTGLLDATTARAPYERAARLGQGEADVLVLVAFYMSKTGRHAEALAAIRRAQALDPLNPRPFRAEGSIQYAARRPAEAIAPLRRALAMNPKLSNAHAILGASYYALGDIAAARAAYDAEPNGSFRLAGVAICARRSGDAATAKTAFDEMVAEYGDGAAYQQAQVLAQANRRDAAIDALLRGRAASDAGLTNMQIDAMLDPLRGDERFKRLLMELGLRA